MVWGGVSVIKWAFSAIESPSSGGQAQGGVAAQQTGSAHESIPPEGIDICELTIQTVSGISLRSNEISSEGPVESNSDGGRYYSDECSWELVPEYGVSVPWEFSLSYNMFVEGFEGNSAVKEAEKYFSEQLVSSKSLFGEVLEEGEGGGVDESHYLYGAAQEDLQVTRYVFLGRVKSTTYQIVFDDKNIGSSGERVPASAFRNEVDKINSRMAIDLGIWVPD